MCLSGGSGGVLLARRPAARGGDGIVPWPRPCLAMGWGGVVRGVVDLVVRSFYIQGLGLQLNSIARMRG